MHRIKAEQHLEDTPLPCDYFNLIGGTSTGGIIALMLGRLQMTVEDTIACYDDLAGRVFSEVKILGDGQYKATLLEEVIKEVVQKRTGNSEAHLLDDGAGTGWEPYIDGGVSNNNPTAHVVEEAELIYPNMNIACVISIGTGKTGTIYVRNPSFLERNVIPIGVIQAVVSMANNCEEMVEQMEKKFKPRPKTYFRFNVKEGLQNVKLGEWNRMDEVASHMRKYMQRQKEANYKTVLEEKGLTHEECMPKTQVKILKEITEWANDHSRAGLRVFWLTGQAGSGKTTISYTIAKQSKKHSNDISTVLGTNFFCLQQFQETQTQKCIIPTIAYQLGLKCKSFANALRDANQFEAINYAIVTRMKDLLIQPWQPSKTERSLDAPPYLIVIDALDEIANNGGPMLQYFTLPPLVRVESTGLH
ncbi:hypothetical protein DXG01_006974 [Tephrocybe rancida]|nr:hypothetical protein DXG01_006974 [Tephrocybe rancida]